MILLHQRVLGLGQDDLERGLVETLKRRYDRKAADEFRDQAVYFGMDVYEEEGPLLFSDLSSTIIQDDVFERLTTFPNVVITGHQAFLTREALTQIADITLSNVSDFEAGSPRAENIITTRK